MISLILAIANIAGGVLLGLTILDKWDGEHNFFNKIAAYLAPFQTIIGGALVVFGILEIFREGNLIYNIISLIGGFLLLTHVIGKAPVFGDTLKKISDKIDAFQSYNWYSPNNYRSFECFFKL